MLISGKIFLHSEAAFDRILFEGFEPADGRIYYPKRKQRDESARLRYRQLAMQIDLDGIYMRDILRDEIKPGDKRLDKQ